MPEVDELGLLPQALPYAIGSGSSHLNGSLDHAHVGHMLYDLHGGRWTIMRWAFMSVHNVHMLPINCYINHIVTHAPLALFPEVDCLLSSGCSHECHVNHAKAGLAKLDRENPTQ